MSKSVRIYHLGEWVDLSTGLIEDININLKATDGIGRFSFKLRTEGTDILNIIYPDEIIEIKENNVILLKGYIDKFIPIAEDKDWAYQQGVEVTGRDYGQDLFNKEAMPFYNLTAADEIIEDLLAGTDITFSVTANRALYTYTPANIMVTYKSTQKEHLIEILRNISEKDNVNFDFYVDSNKQLHFFPIGTVVSGITLNNVAGTSNIIKKLENLKFDMDEVRNSITVVGSGISDGWSDDEPTYLGWVGATGNTVTKEDTIFTMGSSLKSAIGTNPNTCELTIGFPKHNYTYLPFDEMLEEEITFDLYYTVSSAVYAYNIYVKLEDSDGEIIEWKGMTYDTPPLYNRCGAWSTDPSYWKNCAFKVGTNVEIQAYGSLGGWWDTWRYITDTSSFNWRVVKITFGAYIASNLTSLIIDNLSIPLPMIAMAHDDTSIAAYKLREWTEYKRDLLTQRELDEFCDTVLAKRKDPISMIKVTALGTAGIIGGVNKWLVGNTLVLNAPNDGFSSVTLVMTDINLKLIESPEDGNDFISEVTLVPATILTRGSRLVDDATKSLRELWDRTRAVERAVGSMSSLANLSGGSSTIIDWMNVPYIHVAGNAYFLGQTELDCECPSYTWVQLEPYLWGYTDGEWTPSGLTLPLGVSYLRFTNTGSDYIDLGLIYNTMDPSPMLWISQHLVVKKDFACGGMLTSFQGALNLGSGLEAEGDMPQIILAHSGSGYGTKDTLEINDVTGALGKVKLQNLYFGASSVIIYRPLDGTDANKASLRVETPSNGGLIVEQALSCNALLINVATGTAPIALNSTTVCSNLNADLLDGHHWSEIPTGGDADTLDGYHASAFLLLTGGTMSGDITITKATPVLELKSTSANSELRFSTNGTNLSKIYQSQSGGNHLVVDTDLSVEHDLNVGENLALTGYTGSPFKINHATNPELLLQDDSVTKFTIEHDGTDGLITVNSGDLKIQAQGGQIYIYTDTVHSGDIVINKTNPSMAWQVSGSNKLQMGYDGSNSFISSVACNLSIASASSYDIILYPPNDHNVILWNGRHLIPQSDGGGQIGQSGCHFNYVYANYVRWDVDGDVFDEYDDLTLVKQWGNKDKNLVGYDKSKKMPPEDNMFQMLKGKDADGKPDTCWDGANLVSFALGCAKALAKKQDEQSDIILKLLDRIEQLEAKLKVNNNA